MMNSILDFGAEIRATRRHASEVKEQCGEKKPTLYSQLQSHCKNFEMTSKPEKSKKEKKKSHAAPPLR